MLKNGIKADFPIMTAVNATYAYVKRNFSSIALYCSESVKRVFDGLNFSAHPEAVVVGDLGDVWNFEILNDIFLKVLNGAKLIAMQKNKYWKHPERGYLLDAGAFIKAVEYATDVKAILIGKPSPIYFNQALELIGGKGKNFIMIGDDLQTDILPVKKLGGRGILMLTGKTSPDMVPKENNKNFSTAKNLIEAIEIIKKIIPAR